MCAKIWLKNCRRKLSGLTYPLCGFNEYDNNINDDNSNKNCNDNNNNDNNNNSNTDNEHMNINNGNMNFSNSIGQCVINQATNDTKIKLGIICDSLSCSLSICFLLNILALNSRLSATSPWKKHLWIIILCSSPTQIWMFSTAFPKLSLLIKWKFVHQ